MNRRSFKRPRGERRYKRMFVLSTEGTITEPQYFSMFNNDTTVLHVKVLKNKGSSPIKVLKELEIYLKENELRPGDEAWLVVDKDRWTDIQLNTLHNWSIKNDQHGLAVSNPKFEYWLLLHFEDGNGIRSSRDCSNKLKRHLPNYDKGIKPEKLHSHINDAIRRAKSKDIPACTDWPHNTGTTVYRLVKALIDS